MNILTSKFARQSNSKLNKWKGYPLLFFVLVLILCFWKVIFHPKEFTLLGNGGDTLSQTYPWFSVGAYWLKKGVLLLWDPYVYAGKANLGELQPGMLYPLNWLFMLLPARGGGVNIAGLEYLLMLNYFLAGYFTFLLARSLAQRPLGAAFSGISYSIAGFMVNMREWVNIFSAFVWMPLIFFVFRKAMLAETRRARWRWLLWCALFLALSFLAGHHAPAIHSGLLISFFVVYLTITNWGKKGVLKAHSMLLALGSTAVMALMFAAAQLLPSIEWGRQAWRWIGTDAPVRWGDKIPYSALEKMDNLSPKDLASLLFPYMSSSHNIYVGIIILFLAITGFLFARNREVQFFGIAAFIFLFISWGQYSALPGWLYSFVPGISFAREIYLFLVPFQLCLALAAGYGLHYLIESYNDVPEHALKVFIRRIGFGLALLAMAAGLIVVIAHFMSNMDWSHPYLNAAAALSVQAIILGSLLFFLHTQRIKPGLFGVFVIAITLLDLASHISFTIHSQNQQPEKANHAIQKVWKIPPVVQYLQSLRQREYFRVDDPSPILPPNFGDVWRLDQTMGHGATGLVRYFDFRGLGWSVGSNASALLNVRYILSRVPIPGMKQVFEADGAKVYFNQRAVPRAFIPLRYRTCENDEQAFDWIKSPLMSPQETAVIMKKDLVKLSPAFQKEALTDDTAFEVKSESCTTASEKQMESVTDAELRNTMTAFQAPWGWSIGDELNLSIRARKPAPDCFLILNYYPTNRDASLVSFQVVGPTSTSIHHLSIAGLEREESGGIVPQKAFVNLGPLDEAVYHVHLLKSETCSANLDSLQISASAPKADVSIGSIQILSYKPNQIKLEADLKRSSFVVLSEVNYPGWEAIVDGAPVTILDADYILRAIPVNSGKHQIVFRFRPRSFYFGLILSLLALSALLVIQSRIGER